MLESPLRVYFRTNLVSTLIPPRMGPRGTETVPPSTEQYSSYQTLEQGRTAQSRTDLVAIRLSHQRPFGVLIFEMAIRDTVVEDIALFRFRAAHAQESNVLRGKIFDSESVTMHKR